MSDASLPKYLQVWDDAGYYDVIKTIQWKVSLHDKLFWLEWQIEHNSKQELDRPVARV